MELDPITREEVYLSAIAGDTSTDDVPEPITRIEFYLKEILDNGSGGGGGGTSNYNSLTNKPQINSTTLSGNKSLSDLGIMPSSTKYAASIALSIDSSTFVVTAQLKDQNGDALGSAQTIDLPLETMVVSGSYDAETEKIVLTLKNGQTVDFSVAALVSGLQSEITAQNKLDADLVDDSESTNKFVTAADKSAWTGKQDALTFNGTYNASTNPAATVSTVTNAIAGLDVASAGGSGKYISAISETDGKISATAETMDTVPTASSTKAVTSGGIHTPIAALVNGGAKNRLPYTLATLKTLNTVGTWNNNTYTRRGITYTVNSDLTITATGTNDGTGDSWLYVYGAGTTNDFVGMVCSGCPEGGALDKYGIQCGNNNFDYGTADGRIATQGAIAIVVRSGYNATAGLTFKPMICSTVDWSISREYVPYCPTNAELAAKTLKFVDVVCYLNSLVFTQSYGTGNNDGIWYTAAADAVSVSDLSVIYSVSISGWESLLVTDVVQPYITGNVSKIGFISNTNTFRNGTYLKIRAIGI